MKRKFNAFLLIGMIGIFTSGSQFAAKYIEAMWGDKDIWWTPMSLALPLNETKNDFTIYLNGEHLQKHIDRGTLSVTGNSGKTYRVASGDVKVRNNNWYKTKASLLHWAVYFALAFGSCATFFGIGFAQWIAQRRRTNQQEQRIA